MGNHFNMKIQAGFAVLETFWPEFAEVQGCIIRKDCIQSGMELSRFYDRTQFETLYNHIHILRLFRHKADNPQAKEAEDDFFLPKHPDFRIACQIGKTMGEILALKLKRDFPTDRFRVYYTEEDSPIVQFHRVYNNEEFLLQDKDADFTDGQKVLIWDTSE